MATITYPLLTVVDDAGAVVTGATVTITSVTTKAGAAIASHGATLNTSGANISVDYDAEGKGEAWIVLAISKGGSTITGLNAAPAFFLAIDSSKIGKLAFGAEGGAHENDVQARVGAIDSTRDSDEMLALTNLLLPFASSKAALTRLIEGLGVGTGDVAVNHNYGSTDAYRLVHSETGEPVDDVQISAYAGSTATGTPVARTRSGSDGRWLASMMLDAGTYTLVFDKAGVFESATAPLTVT